MKNSAIQWTDHTFNAWEGCTKVAPECKNCYAEVLVDKRFGRAKWGKGQPRRRTSETLWKQPIAWNKILGICNQCGEPKTYQTEMCPNCGTTTFRRVRVFCLSLGDWLDDEVPIEWLADLLALIHATPNLDWQLLTKRPQSWRSRIEEAACLAEDTDQDDLADWLCAWLDCVDMPERGDMPENIWIGVSAGADQKAALDIPAKIHFLSCEPMLHALDTTHAADFDWIIFGGESGKNARPCDVQWIGDGVTFCQAQKIACFVKQLGSYVRNTIDFGGWPNGTQGVDLHDSKTLELIETRIKLRDSHGGDWLEWPEDLRVREFPRVHD